MKVLLIVDIPSVSDYIVSSYIIQISALRIDSSIYHYQIVEYAEPHIPSSFNHVVIGRQILTLDMADPSFTVLFNTKSPNIKVHFSPFILPIESVFSSVNINRVFVTHCSEITSLAVFQIPFQFNQLPFIGHHIIYFHFIELVISIADLSKQNHQVVFYDLDLVRISHTWLLF